MLKRLLGIPVALAATVIFAVQGAAVVFVNPDLISATLSSGGTRVDVTVVVECDPGDGVITFASLFLQQELADSNIVGGQDFRRLSIPCTGAKNFIDFEIFESFFSGVFESWECGPTSKPADALLQVTLFNNGVFQTLRFKPEISIDCFDP